MSALLPFSQLVNEIDFKLISRSTRSYIKTLEVDPNYDCYRGPVREGSLAKGDTILLHGIDWIARNLAVRDEAVRVLKAFDGGDLVRCFDFCIYVINQEGLFE